MMYHTCGCQARRVSIWHLVVVVITLMLGLAGPSAGSAAMPTGLEKAPSHLIYLPLVEHHQWVTTSLDNGDFEGPVWHRTHTGATYDNIRVPEGWTAFWREGNLGNQEFGRPEMDIIPHQDPYLNPPRVYTGNHALKWFTFYRNGDVGVYQRIPAVEGAWYRVRAYVHTWYSTEDDPAHSQWRDSEGLVHPLNNGDPGMTAMMGLDPTGGTDPYAPTVIWHSANVYDQYAPLELTAIARGQSITLFLRTTTLFPFKHCDAYWDAVTLEVAE